MPIDFFAQPYPVTEGRPRPGFAVEQPLGGAETPLGSSLTTITQLTFLSGSTVCYGGVSSPRFRS